jgi:hypothetical protein
MDTGTDTHSNGTAKPRESTELNATIFAASAGASHESATEPDDRTEAQALMLESLAKSGITDPDVIAKCFEARSAEETLRITGFAHVPSYREIFFEADGNPIADYVRYRLLGKVVGQKGKTLRYWVPKGSPVKLFIPPLLIIREEMKKRAPCFVLVEGNKKAIALCLKGIPALAIQGVSTFSQKKRGIFLIPELKELCALQPEIWVCFDADVVFKTEVKDAQNALMRELLNAGARPFHITLPLSPTGAGADDYMLDHTKEDFEKLPRDEYALTKPLFDLNDDYGVVSSPPAILVRSSGKLINEAQFRLIAPRTRVMIDGKPKRAFEIWIRDFELATRYSGLAYEPGLRGELPDGRRNQYVDTGVSSQRGSVRPFFRLLENLFPDPKMRRFAVAWLAYLMQYKGVKLQTALVLHGSPGTGKTTFAYLLLRLVFGQSNVGKIGNAELGSSFTGWLANRQIIVCEEVSGTDTRHDYAKLKDYISGETALINEKYVPAYELRNTAAFIFLSNDRVPVYLTADDRRYAISHVKEKWPESEIAAIRTWAENGGASAVRYYLEHLTLAGFDPFARPPMSRDKAEVIAQARSGLEAWACELMSDDERPAFTTHKFLMAAAEGYSGQKATRKAVTTALEKAGASKMGQYRISLGGKDSIWCLKERPTAEPTGSEIGNIFTQSAAFFGMESRLIKF